MIKKIASVPIWVDDFVSALYFYQVILGLELISQHGDVPQLKVGNGILVLVKGKLAPPKDAFPSDFPVVSLEVEDLDKMVRKLSKENIELMTSIDERRDSRWIKLRDPSGNLIELVEINKR